MTDLPTLIGLAGSLVGAGEGEGEGATEIARNIKSLVERPDHDTTELRLLVSQLLDALIRMQAEQITMQDAVRHADEEKRRIERFEAQSSRYTLERSEFGSFAYVIKQSDGKGEATHCLCANCFGNQVQAILQPVDLNKFQCPNCKATVFWPDGRDNGAMSVPTRRGRFDGNF